MVAEVEAVALGVPVHVVSSDHRPGPRRPARPHPAGHDGGARRLERRRQVDAREPLRRPRADGGEGGPRRRRRGPAHDEPPRADPASRRRRRHRHAGHPRAPALGRERGRHERDLLRRGGARGRVPVQRLHAHERAGLRGARAPSRRARWRTSGCRAGASCSASCGRSPSATTICCARRRRASGSCAPARGRRRPAGGNRAYAETGWPTMSSGLTISAKWQALGCPWPRSTSAGSSSAQIGCAFQQRVRKRQPDGGFAGLGTSPSSTIRLRLPALARLLDRHRRQQRLRVRMRRLLVDLVLRPDLDDLAEVHDGDAVGDVADDRQVVRDEDVRQAEVALERLEQVHDLRADRDVERGHRLVEDDQLRVERERARDADALALAARELVREPVRMLGREADGAQQLVDALLALVAAVAAVDAQRLADDVAHGHARVQRRVRVLEDDLHLAPHVAHLAAVERRDVAAVEEDLPARRLDELDDRARRASSCRSRTRRRGRASRPPGSRGRRRRRRGSARRCASGCRRGSGSA